MLEVVVVVVVVVVVAVEVAGAVAVLKDSWEGRLPPKCKSKASVRSLPGPGPGQNYVVSALMAVVVLRW